jgi:hypothetical protein
LRQILTEIDQAVTDAVGLMKPDAVLIIHADVPEGVDLPGGIERQGQPSLIASVALSISVGISPSSCLDSDRIARIEIITSAALLRSRKLLSFCLRLENMRRNVALGERLPEFQSHKCTGCLSGC